MDCALLAWCRSTAAASSLSTLVMDDGAGMDGSALLAESSLSDLAVRCASVAVLAGLCAGSLPLFLIESSGVLLRRGGELSRLDGRGELSCECARACAAAVKAAVAASPGWGRCKGGTVCCLVGDALAVPS